MKRVLVAVATVCALSASLCSATPSYGRGNDRFEARPYGLPPGHAKRLWRRGQRIPTAYIVPDYFVVEPGLYHLAPPRRGYRWVIVEGDAYLVQPDSGMIADVVIGVTPDVDIRYDRYDPPPVVVVDRDDRWRRRYVRTYTYTDDSFYQECRRSVDPAGVIGGALIGGLLGNAIGRGGGRTGATVAGVVVGGALGAGLTSHLECEDRSYAYKTYYDGFNAGRANAVYRWRNPNTGHYGTFRVVRYYDDPDGFRCANYTQEIVVEGQPQLANGRACQQPDGTWTIVS